VYRNCVLCDVGIEVFSIIYINATLDGLNSYTEEISVVTPVKDTTWTMHVLRWQILWGFIWRSWDRASWYISIVKPTRCTIFEFIEYHSTRFGRSFCPSSGVQYSTHGISYMSYLLVDCLLAGTRWNEFHLVPARKQSTNLYDLYLMLYVQSWTSDDVRKDHAKHVEW